MDVILCLLLMPQAYVSVCAAQHATISVHSLILVDVMYDAFMETVAKTEDTK